MKPVRVQLSRRKGWRLPPNTVVVSRPSRWENPWPVRGNQTAEIVVARYQKLIAPALDLRPLRGKNLACWCSLDQPCHADVLLRLANQ